MSEPNEIWVCGHTRKCRWQGTKDETALVIIRPGVSEYVCPKCGFNEFYIGKPRPAKKHAEDCQCANCESYRRELRNTMNEDAAASPSNDKADLPPTEVRQPRRSGAWLAGESTTL